VGLSLASPRALKPIIPAVEGVNASEGVAWAALCSGGGGGAAGGAVVEGAAAAAAGAVA
jgi:hypothetical protein